MNNINTTWGGVFSEDQDDIMTEINQSITFDYVLYKQDIKGSIAHAKMLSKQNIITKEDFDAIQMGLLQIKKEIEDKKFVFNKELEDIHMNIENRLYEIIGEPAKRLHTARSRNDQVATDFKMFIKDSILETKNLLNELLNTIIIRSKENQNTFMPAFTHLQTAQPTLLAHHLLCYGQMFLRDLIRLDNLYKNMSDCPLGSCAVTGTSYNIDRFFVAQELGFDKPCINSIDGVSDRDFVIEFSFVLTMISIHLTRLMEEFVLWSTANFNFIKFSDKFSSGSSIMPQKKNPDAAELVRGKSGRVIGSLVSLLVTIKSLPLAYSKDMQEDKEPIFDSIKTIRISLQATTGMMMDFSVNKLKMKESAMFGHSTATDLADYLVKKFKIPFREAHHITGSIVKLANQKECNLWDLTLQEMQQIESRIQDDIYQVIKLEKSVESKKSYGGTSFESINHQIEYIQNILSTIC